MLLNYSISYCQTDDCGCETSCFSTGYQEESDSVLISINDIRNVNNKLIERKYYKSICAEQEDIISLKDSYIIQQDSIISSLQYRIIRTTDINNQIQRDYDKQKHRTIVWGSIAGATSVCFIGCLIGLIYK